MTDFDELPFQRKPNPLPCGCGIFGVEGINVDGSETEFRDLHIRYCPVHAAAPSLLAELEATLDWLQSFSMPPTSTIQEKQERMAAIEKAIALVRKSS
jgi:hypothetical protein